jgi:hypothetical protein
MAKTDRISTKTSGISKATEASDPLDIEIKTLRVGGRRMTQSMFNQIQRENIDDSLTGNHLKGIPLGRVEYHKPACRKDYPAHHVHIIWQKGSELRKCVVSRYDNVYTFYDQMRQLDQIFIAV